MRDTAGQQQFQGRLRQNRGLLVMAGLGQVQEGKAGGDRAGQGRAGQVTFSCLYLLLVRQLKVMCTFTSGLISCTCRENQ